MGQAREVMDAITAAVTAGDANAVASCYAPDAVADTPDVGRLEGREAIVEYLLTFAEAFSDMGFELTQQLELGDIAIDEGFMLGTHTGTLRAPDGDIPPSGRSVRIRECDIIAVRDGAAISHRFYFDQLEFLTQLGLIDPQALAGAQPAQRIDLTSTEQPQRV